MGVFDRFPFTNFHELNLDWIMQEIGRYDEIISSFQAWQVESEEDLRAMQSQVQLISNQMESFQTDMERDFANLQYQLEQQIAGDRAALQNEIRNSVTSLQNQITQLIADTQRQLAQMQQDIDRAILVLQGQLEGYVETTMTWVNARLQQFLDDFPTVYDLPVENPVTGTTTSINVALADLYDRIRRDGALTAFEYELLGLTASDYDNFGLTAEEYDLQGRFRLGYPDLRFSMLDPFTGTWQLISTVVQKLADLHRNALTALNYDNKLLDADTYDGLALTSYDYDFNGASLIP